MPRYNSIGSAIEVAKLNSENAIIALLEVDVKDITGAVQETLYLCRNTEDFVYEGQVYSKSAFEFSIQESSTKVPEVSLNTIDFTKEIQKRIDAYDGGVGFRARLKVVNSGIVDDRPIVDEEFSVLSTTIDNYRIEFKLGAQNPLTRRYPWRLQFKDRCSWVYKSEECGYSGALPTCDFSLQGSNGCAVHNNANRFGGFPGLGNQ